MKSFLLTLLFLGVALFGVCQTKAISVGTGVTTTLVFESDVRHVDLGSKSLLAQQTKEAPQVLLIKAAQKDFPSTNISIVTADGQVYALQVDYDPAPRQWIYHIAGQNKTSLKVYAESILGNGGRIKAVRNDQSALAGMVKGIYTKDDVLFFHLAIDNNSQIPFDINRVRFSIRDRKKARRTASQESDLSALETVGRSNKIPAEGKIEMVIVFRKFTFPDGKYLNIEVSEKEGSRQLALRLKNKMILSARLLPEVK